METNTPLIGHILLLYFFLLGEVKIKVNGDSYLIFQ